MVNESVGNVMSQALPPVSTGMPLVNGQPFRLAVKRRHSPGLNRSTGPCVSLESRTAESPSGSEATSTQLSL